jgi:UDP-N-acetylmuramoyl-L-alanyl-D-glutamate--2,6-diaminopimelate ligase
MKLSALLNSDVDKDVTVNGITSDSRKVEPNFLFAALSGVNADGTAYIDQARARGASAIITEDQSQTGSDIIQVKNAREAYALIASRFYQGQPDHIYAVTGTSGKSSVVWFARVLLNLLGHKAASIGTMGVYASGFYEKTLHTSPDPAKLHETVALLTKDHKVTDLAIEASSHGLDQHRLDGLNIKVAAFTNFSHEHLDYHESLSAYLNAKARLFAELLPENGTAVLNADIPEFAKLAEICLARGLPHITYGKKGRDIVLLSRTLHAKGQKLALSIRDQGYELDLPLIGAFQAENILCAFGMILAGRPDTDVAKMIEIAADVKPVPGRLEPVEGHPKGATIFVDYAHKPGALETVLEAIRPHTEGQLHVLFGCGGDRDKAKRAIMGGIADRLADRIIVTDDNPRSEDPSVIRQSIMDGITHPSKAENIGDRREAIRFAISSLQTGDSLIIAGKGHETGQTIGTQILPFDDREVTRDELKRLEQSAA